MYKLIVLLLKLQLTFASCKWTPVTPNGITSFRFMSAASTSVGNAIAWCGGTNLNITNGKFLQERNQVTTYNPTSNTWTTLPNMTARSAPACAYLSGRLYVFGGVQKKINASHHDPDPTIKLSLVESIAVTSDGTTTETKWRKEMDLPFGPRESPSTTSLSNNEGIVFAGGFDSGETKGSFNFQYYNTSYLFNGKTYTPLPDMPFKRSNFALVSKKNVVYAFGGGETEPSYETCASLDMIAKTKRWIPCPLLINPRSWMAAGVVQNQIIIAGGMDGMFSPTSEVDVLKVVGSRSASNWTDSNCDLPSAAGFLSGAVTDGGEFVVYIGTAEKNNAYIYSQLSV